MIELSSGVVEQYRHVLVPIDGTERSTIALRTGRAVAARLGAVLHTVSASADTAELGLLRNAAASALGVDCTDPRVHVVESEEPASAIAAVADALDSCVVCMSTHAHDRFAGALLGSSARELLQTRGQPVVMVGPMADRPVYLGEAWAAPLAIERVVACVDADPAVPAAQLVAIAGGWAQALGMSLTILNVAAPEMVMSGTPRTDRLDHWMAELVRDASMDGLWVDSHVEVDPVGVVDGVRTYLAGNPAGLLVVSTNARNGVDRLMHGATAAAITSASTIATLVVPAQGGVSASN